MFVQTFSNRNVSSHACLDLLTYQVQEKVVIRSYVMLFWKVGCVFVDDDYLKKHCGLEMAV